MMPRSFTMQKEGEEKEKNIDWDSLCDKMPHMNLELILKSWDRLKEEVAKEVSLKGHRQVLK